MNDMSIPSDKMPKPLQERLFSQLKQYEKGELGARKVVGLYEQATPDDIEAVVERGCQLQTIRKIAVASFNEAIRNPRISEKKGWEEKICQKLQRAVVVRESGGFWRTLFYFFAHLLGIPTEVDRSRVELQRLRLHGYILAQPGQALHQWENSENDIELRYDLRYAPFQLSEITDPKEKAFYLIAVVNAALRTDDLNLANRALDVMKSHKKMINAVEDTSVKFQWYKKIHLLEFLVQNDISLSQVNEINANKYPIKAHKEIDARLKHLANEIGSREVSEIDKKVLLFDLISWLEEKTEYASYELPHISKAILDALYSPKLSGSVKEHLLLVLINWVKTASVDDPRNEEVFGTCLEVYDVGKKNYLHLSGQLMEQLASKAEEVLKIVKEHFATTPPITDYVKKLLVGFDIDNSFQSGTEKNMIQHYYLDITRIYAIQCGGNLVHRFGLAEPKSAEQIHELIANYLKNDLFARIIQPIVSQKVNWEHYNRIVKLIKDKIIMLRNYKNTLNITKTDQTLVIHHSMIWPVQFKGIIASQSPIGYLETERKITIPIEGLNNDLPLNDKTKKWESVVPELEIEDTIGAFTPAPHEHA